MTFLLEGYGVIGTEHTAWQFLTDLSVKRGEELVAVQPEQLLCGEVATGIFQSSAGTTRATVERLT
jgi:hypothetical protein